MGLPLVLLVGESLRVLMRPGVLTVVELVGRIVIMDISSCPVNDSSEILTHISVTWTDKFKATVENSHPRCSQHPRA